MRVCVEASVAIKSLARLRSRWLFALDRSLGPTLSRYMLRNRTLLLVFDTILLARCIHRALRVVSSFLQHVSTSVPTRPPDILPRVLLCLDEGSLPHCRTAIGCSDRAGLRSPFCWRSVTIAGHLSHLTTCCDLLCAIAPHAARQVTPIGHSVPLLSTVPTLQVPARQPAVEYGFRCGRPSKKKTAAVQSNDRALAQLTVQTGQNYALHSKLHFADARARVEASRLRQILCRARTAASEEVCSNRLARRFMPATAAPSEGSSSALIRNENALSSFGSSEFAKPSALFFFAQSSFAMPNRAHSNEQKVRHCGMH